MSVFRYFYICTFEGLKLEVREPSSLSRHSLSLAKGKGMRVNINRETKKKRRRTTT
jgi:hypothetical protein